MELSKQQENRLFVSEQKDSFLVYDRSTGNLYHVCEKEKLNDVIAQIMKTPERDSQFVKADENVFKLNLSTTCNLNCDYCFRDKKSHIQTDVEKAKKIKIYLNNVNSTN